MTNEIEMLKTLIAPTHNKITDRFGFTRDWGLGGWIPSCTYSPIHGGVDYSSRPQKTIVAPCDGIAWGMMISGPVGSCIMFLPSGCKNIALYFFHCEPGIENRWASFGQGEILSTQAKYGTIEEHLHYEITVTEKLGKDLVEAKIIRQKKISDSDITKKAKLKKIDQHAVIAVVNGQKKGWGISEIYEDYFIRTGLPDYRRSRLSKIGQGETWSINPELFGG